MINIFIAVFIDVFIGDPKYPLHPIRLIGKLISRLEKIVRSFFTNNLKLGGLFLFIFAIIIPFLMTNFLSNLFYNINYFFGSIFSIYILYSCIAARCLHNESFKIKTLLSAGKIVSAREALSYIVGRDTYKLNETEISKAVIETTAENTIDGVLAPLFFMFIGSFFDMSAQFGIVYKTINTLDSMIGYNQDPYKEIGYFSAKIDDLVNFIPSRLGSIIMIIAGLLIGKDANRGMNIFKRDRLNHKSPNSGHPESVIAGLLGIQLGGTSYYFGEKVSKPTIGDNLKRIEISDIIDTVRIMYVSEFLFMFIFSIIYLIL